MATRTRHQFPRYTLYARQSEIPAPPDRIVPSSPDETDDERSCTPQRIRNVIHQIIGQAFLNGLSNS